MQYNRAKPLGKTSKRPTQNDDIILRSSDIPPALLKKLEDIAEKQQRPVK